MEQTKDWTAVVTPRVLLVGENATLQWSDQVIEYVMFLDYYFRDKPYDHGERSRYKEAQSILRCINELSSDRYRAQEVYATNLSMEQLKRPPHGKHLFIPESEAVLGMKRIYKILVDNPTIETVFLMSLQVNFWMQTFGFYSSDEQFVHAAQPRRAGITESKPYYQPVDAKAFNNVCGNVYHCKIGERAINVVPILPAKDYPLYGANIGRFSAAYEKVKEYFAAMNKAEKEILK